MQSFQDKNAILEVYTKVCFAIIYVHFHIPPVFLLSEQKFPHIGGSLVELSNAVSWLLFFYNL